MEGNVNKAGNYAQLPNGISALLEKNKNATFYGVASGRSMEGVGIFDGDLLLIDRSAAVRQGDVIVVVYNGQFVCKIADIKNNQLVSASDDYPPVKIKETDEYNLEGVVTSSVRMHRGSVKGTI